PEVTILATTPNAAEPATNGVFTVYRTGDTGTPLTVNYTVGGTATPGADYALLSGSVTIAADQVSATITVAVIDDLLAEGDETVILTLTPSVNYTVMSPSTATVTITDNDVPGVSISAISGPPHESASPATL